MGTVAAKITTEEFLALPEEPGVKRELIDGEVREEGVISMGTGGPKHEQVKLRLNRQLGAFFGRHAELPEGVAAETMFPLGPDESLQPGLSIVLRESLDPEKSGRITTAPDIAIEIVSSESADSLQRKVAIYLEYGVRCVWVAYPSQRVIDVYEGETVTRLHSNGKLEHPLLPGFSVPVEAFFQGV